jgi:isopenicillin N synthase-like dioxygenase
MADTPVLDGIPVVDVGAWLAREESPETAAASAAECEKVAAALHQYGILCIKDPRVTAEDNDNFLDMLESYFEQPEEDKVKDVRKELSYQVGATPSATELPRDHCERMKAFKDADKPLSLCPPELDPKWRFFWRMGERPASTAYGELNAEPVVPAAFPQWPAVMNTWGSKLLQGVTNVAEMAAVGFGLPANTFSDLMNMGPHLLAPTASNFYKFGAKGTVLAGFHYDLNFLTIHGRSRFPGLYIWTREGKKVLVRVPEGCLLVQAGKQFEYATGGHVLAGFHEVVVVDETLAAIERAREAGRSLWRISSTLFGHLASDTKLQPLAKFATEEALAAYPPVDVGEQVNQELAAIKLGAVAPTADTPEAAAGGVATVA